MAPHARFVSESHHTMAANVVYNPCYDWIHSHYALGELLFTKLDFR